SASSRALVAAHSPRCVVHASHPLPDAVATQASSSALESAVAKLFKFTSLQKDGRGTGVGGGSLHAGFSFSTIEASRCFGVDKTCPPPKAFSAGCEGATGWVWSRRLRSSEHSPCFSNRRL